MKPSEDEVAHVRGSARQTEPKRPPGETASLADNGQRPETAERGRRIAAAFIDCCVAGFLYVFLGWLGSFEWLSLIVSAHVFWLVPVAYVLLRDMYVEGKPIGVGKRLAKLEVVCVKTQSHPDLICSVQRNLLFAFPPVSLFTGGLELYLLVKDPAKKRFGDHFADTIVVQKATS